MTRVGIFVPSLRGGGAERVTVTISNGLAAAGHRVDLVLVRAEGPYLREVSPSVRMIDLGRSRASACLPGLIRYLRANRPEVILSVTNYANVVAIVARALAGVPTRVVVSEHSTPSNELASGLKSAMLRAVMRLTYPLADGVIAVSRGISEELQRDFGVPLERLHTIHNPIDVAAVRRFANERPQHPWLAPGRPPVLLAAGRLVPEKDYPTLLAAFARLRKERPLRLVILGDGPELQRLTDLAKALGVGDDVDFLGFVGNPWGWMAACSVYVLSSRWEGLPTVLIEAMACGAPIVSTDCRNGPNEILQGGLYGDLVPVGDEVALADSIGRQLSRGQRTDFSDCLQRFEIDTVMDAYARTLQLQPGSERARG